jgi:fatty-acyl-CoA synthase
MVDFLENRLLQCIFFTFASFLFATNLCGLFMMNAVVGAVVAFFAVFLTSYWRTISGLAKLLSMLYENTKHTLLYKNKPFSYADYVESKVDENPEKVKFILAETGEKRTLIEVDALANQIANWGLTKRCKQKNSIALMLLNNVDYFSIWYGFSKIGVSTALLNTNVLGKAFLHSVETSLVSSEVKILILDINLKEPLQKELDELTSKGIQIFLWGDTNFAGEIAKQTRNRPDKGFTRNEIKDNDSLIFIFTSGTTGLPKACKISQFRYYMGAIIYPVLGELTNKDVIYSAMPLYHSAAGLMSVGGSIRSGATLVIRKKFSATNFTKECLQYGVTTVQYIGELCRYLVNLPPNEDDQKLAIRVAFGNGMRKEYWTKFTERYHVKHVVEFYAATEGNVGLFNCFDKIGPLGYVPWFLDILYPLKLVRTDPNDQR